MNICILFDTTPKTWGGANQFLKTLTVELKARGHTVTKRPNKSTQIVLLNAFLYAPGTMLNPNRVAQVRQTGKFNLLGSLISKRFWMSRRRKGPILVHRLDGVAELVRGVKTVADEIHPAVNSLCDYTIFQTEYCRRTFEGHSNVVPEEFSIINNGVSDSVFQPKPARDGKLTDDQVLKFIAVSWSSNVRKGFAKLAELSLVDNVEVTFAGNWAPEIPLEKVKLAGVIDSNKLSDLMRESDALIHAALDEPCANVIVEGMASGLPVLYRDSGGNAELAADYGVALTEDIATDVSRLRKNFDDLQSRVVRDREKFLIPRVVVEYESLFEEAIALRENGGLPG